MSGRPGFMLYFDTAPAFERLSDEGAGRLIKAMLAYASTGELVPLDDNLALLFELIRPRLDRDAEKYEQTVQKRKYGGYRKACLDRGETPLEYEVWVEHARACTSVPTATATPTAAVTATIAATPTSATAETANTYTNLTAASAGSGKGSLRVNPDDDAEFERQRREQIAKLTNYAV